MNKPNERIVNGEIIEIPDSSTLAVLQQAEIDTAIATAKRYPRELSRFKDDVITLATVDSETALTMFYSLPGRGGPPIQGPSVRLAEIVGSCWQNLRYASRVIGEDGDFIVAQGVCQDLERNTSASVEVRRRIVRADGSRYGVDMIGVTANAACSVALRNAILRIVPRAFIDPLMERIKAVALGEGKTKSQRVEDAIKAVAELGVDEAKLLKSIGRRRKVDVTIEDLYHIAGAVNAVKQGMATADDAFAPPRDSSKVSRSDLNDRVANDDEGKSA